MNMYVFPYYDRPNVLKPTIYIFQDRMNRIQNWINNLWETESTSYAPSAPDSSVSNFSHAIKSSVQVSDKRFGIINNFGDNIVKSSESATRRLFTDDEVRLLVRIFREYFESNTTPGLADVRRKISQTVLETNRGASSVRSKFKRLQIDNQWATFL